MTAFKELIEMNDIETFINDSELTFLYIGKPNCSVCESLLPQVKNVMENFPSIKTAYIDTEKTPKIAGRFNIFTVPVLILFYNGNEYLREARIVPIEPFKEKVNRIVEGVNSDR